MTLRLNATIIEEGQQDGEDKNFYTSIGAAFEHQDQKGFDVKLKAIPTNGEFSLFLPKDHDEDFELEDHTYMNVLLKETTKNDDDTYNNFYHKVGVAYPHKKGLNVDMFAFPLKDNMQIVIRLPKEDV